MFIIIINYLKSLSFPLQAILTWTLSNLAKVDMPSNQPPKLSLGYEILEICISYTQVFRICYSYISTEIRINLYNLNFVLK